jgi:hypothetical protein
VAHSFVAEVVSGSKGVLKWSERIFRFRVASEGRRIAADFTMDVFEAVVASPNLSESSHHPLPADGRKGGCSEEAGT